MRTDANTNLPAHSNPIIVIYRSADRCYIKNKYATLRGARTFAQRYVGPTPTLGSNYAVSDDGIGTIYVEGCSLRDLFPNSLR